MDLKQPFLVDHEPVATKHADYDGFGIRSAAEAGLATASDRFLVLLTDCCIADRFFVFADRFFVLLTDFLDRFFSVDP